MIFAYIFLKENKRPRDNFYFKFNLSFLIDKNYNKLGNISFVQDGWSMNYFFKLRYLSQPKLIGHVTATSRIENKNAYPKLRSSFHDLSRCARKTFELTNWPKRHACWLLLLRFSNFFFPTLELSSRDLLPALDSNLYGRIDLGAFRSFLELKCFGVPQDTEHGTS